MNERVRAIVEETRKLSPEERLELFGLLEVEFSREQDGTPEEIEAAWIEEVERRIAEAEREGTQFLDFEEVMTRARQLIR